MTKTSLPLAAGGTMLLLAACSAGSNEVSSASTPMTPASPAPTGSAATSTTMSPAAEPSADQDNGETRVRFTAGDARIIVRTTDNPTSRAFISMLPLTLQFEDFANAEKIGYLPRRLTTEGSTGSAPANGDLIYYVPWGNLGFYYNTAGIGYSDQTIHLGTYDASRDQLEQLEGQEVIVEVVR